MSQCCQSTDSFIKLLFGPRIAVLCSQDAEIISRRNNLSFTELIRPFCTINNELKAHDPSSNQAFSIRDLHITVIDLRCKVPDENVIANVLSDVVAEASQKTADNCKTWNIDSERYQVNVNVSCPWFEIYRDTICSMASQKFHEYINHCLSCLLVVSSSHPNPLEEFSNLSQHQNYIQHNSQNAPIRWMTPNTLKYYVLLHDNSNADLNKARSVMNDLQGMYGFGACHLLCINSKDSQDDQQLPDPWSRFVSNRPTSLILKEPNGITINDARIQDSLNMDPVTVSTEIQANAVEWVKELKQVAVIPQKGYGCCLTLSDHDNLRMFMLEYSSKGLIPHLEKLLRNFYEQISSRKGLHRSIFRVTRTIFGGGKAASAPALKNYSGGNLESPELQVRKIADLFFLCQMYESAYNYYHSIKKDFTNDQALLHAAGAAEMAAFSNFMQLRSQRAYPTHYVDMAIDTYLNKSVDKYLAIRCVFVSLECLRTQGLYIEAATQLKKLVNEENNLQSAIIWEQIAQCYLRTKKPNLRKFAFYILLAGHRYNKAMQYNCALTCYQTALQVYSGTGWGAAIDFINFTIGKLYFQLNLYNNATLAFELLLKNSSQSPSQQAVYINEYLHVSKFNSLNSKVLASLPLPVILQADIVLRSTDISTHSLNNKSWKFLNDAVSSVINKDSVTSPLPYIKDKKSSFETVLNEPFWIDVVLQNPLQVGLAMRDITLLIEVIKSNESTAIDSPVISEFILVENSTKVLTFCLKPTITGHFKVVGINYSLSLSRITSFSSQTSLGNTELDGHQRFEAVNLKFTVCPPLPKLEITRECETIEIFCGEVFACNISFSNVGQCKMKNLFVAIDSPRSSLFTDVLQSPSSVREHFLQVTSMDDSTPFCSVQQFEVEKLNNGECLKSILWLHAPEVEGRQTINFLFYFEAAKTIGNQTKWRSLKYQIDFYTKTSLTLCDKLYDDNSQTGNILTVNVKNSGLSYSFHCTTLSCISDGLVISKVASMPAVYLQVNQSTILYFNISDQFRSKFSGRYQYINLYSGEDGDESVKVQADSFKLYYYSKNGTVGLPSSCPHLVLALHWLASFEKKVAAGQHYLKLTELQNDRKSLGKIGIDQDCAVNEGSNHTLLAMHQLVKWQINISTIHLHDFQNFALCFVPVEITFQNQYFCNLEVNVNADEHSQSRILGNQSANPHVIWTGKSVSKMNLKPKESNTIKLRACFSAPGLYNINSFSVWAVPTKLKDAMPMMPQNCSYSCLVTVKNSK